MDRFEDLLARTGLSAEELAEVLDLPISTLTDYRLGRLAPPSRISRVIHGLAVVNSEKSNSNGCESTAASLSSLASAQTPHARTRNANFRQKDGRLQKATTVNTESERLHPVSLIKSKKRVADHGEVFTPSWMVEAMLDLVKGETERIDSRFLEPACGSGNFLVRILQRKLAAVEIKYGQSDFEKRQYALLAVMCLYGIELLEDNIAECRANMLEVLADYLNLNEADDLCRAASYVLSQNLVHGDALAMRTSADGPITFAQWGYLGKGKFQRRDFRLDVLTHMSGFAEEGSLFAHLGKHEIFTPTKTYPPITVSDLAAAAHEGPPKEAA